MKTKSLFLTLLALVVATGLAAKVKKIGMIGLAQHCFCQIVQ